MPDGRATDPTDPTDQSDPVSPYTSNDSKKLHDAAHKALDFYLNPKPEKPRNSVDRGMQMFKVDPDINPEAIAIQTKLETEYAGSGTTNRDVFEELELLYRAKGDSVQARRYAERKDAAPR